MEFFFQSATPSPLQLLPDPFPEAVPIRLYLKRDDQLHPQVSGNKWRKLKYNLLEARRLGHHTLLTYGGAHSNHVQAVAAAGSLFGFRTIGVIRGEDRAWRNTPTLAYARTQGMQLHFVSRTAYRIKTDEDFRRQLHRQYGDFFEIPEGGSNPLAVKGVAEVYAEIAQQLDAPPDLLACPVGTGGTLAGLVAAAPASVGVLGFSALKGGDFLEEEVRKLITAYDSSHTALPHFQLLTDYHFGGYARTTPELLSFIRAFEQQTGVRIEQVYTGKMLYGIFDAARRGVFPERAKIIALHTGGMQGRMPELDGD